MLITIGDLCKDIGVLRVKFDSALKVLVGFIPTTLASIDIACEQEGQRIVRQAFLCQLQFRPGAVVVEITPIKMFGASEMGFARVGAEAGDRLDSLVGHGQTRRSMICTQKIKKIVSMCQLVIGKGKSGIALNRF